MRGSWASSDANRKSMQGNKGRDTKPELAVRRLLHAQGFRYRVNFRPEKDLRRTADLVFTKAKVAIFIDGCFWHGCSEHFRASTTNIRYWSEKIATNRARDDETNQALRHHGWTVLRFWEHQLPAAVATEIAKVVASKRNSQTSEDLDAT